MAYAGQIAALLTAFCWSTNSVFFTLAGRRVGSPTVNVTRLGLAWFAMIALHLVVLGSPWPMAAGSSRLMWLGISGLIGFAAGDAVLFEAFVRLGPRLAMLIMTLWPVMAALMAWAFLGEQLTLAKVGAMGVTLGGIAFVVSGGSSAADTTSGKTLGSGILLAVLGALGQATGFLFSKFGLAGGFHPISANLVRVTAGILGLTLWMGLRRELGPNLAKLKDRKAFGWIAMGAVAGPVTGVILSLYAQAHAPLGIAATLMSLSPVILMPVSALVFHEKITARAIVGTCITVAGAAALFLL